jgi:DNA-binding CsgD family transcriptional regulator
MCYQALYRRSSPCPGCPIYPVPDRPFQRSGVTRPGTPGRSLTVTQGRSAGSGGAKLTAWQISDKLFSGLVHARVAQLAEASSLSGREREVLDLLVIGRSLAEIASILGISPRTVKFHQANVLEKTGADSRLDLVRRILSNR